jgi:hypothetical protein
VEPALEWTPGYKCTRTRHLLRQMVKSKSQDYTLPVHEPGRSSVPSELQKFQHLFTGTVHCY